MAEILQAGKLYVSDDKSPFHEDDDSTTPATGASVVEAAQSQFVMADQFLGMVSASWDASALSDLEAICRMGIVIPANGKRGEIISYLRGPLELGNSVTRYELRVGLRTLDASSPPRHFVA